MSYCARCGHQVAGDASFCASCGTAVSPPAAPAAADAQITLTPTNAVAPLATVPAAHTPPAAAPHNGQSGPDPATPSVSSPTAVTTQPVVLPPTHTSPHFGPPVSAPVVPTPAPPGAIPAPGAAPPGAPGPGRRRNNKLALFAGAGAAIVAVLALGQVLLPDPEPAPPPPRPGPEQPVDPGGPQPQPPEQQPVGPGGQQPQPQPTAEGLAATIPQQVGDFEAVSAERWQLLPEGAIDGYFVVYERADGQKAASHGVWAWEDPAAATTFAADVAAETAGDESLPEIGRDVVVDTDGAEIGAYVAFSDGQTMVLGWSNGSIAAILQGGPADVEQLWKDFPY